MGVADVVHGAAVDAIQCVWSADGAYPGEPGYPDTAFRRPIYGRAWWS
ncbi:MAG TPA: hypothetical protein VNB94_13115 [Mycobacteriales bacterium]|nr:hypothetical protein [Mycobacteriales bacterium]